MTRDDAINMIVDEYNAQRDVIATMYDAFARHQRDDERLYTQIAREFDFIVTTTHVEFDMSKFDELCAFIERINDLFDECDTILIDDVAIDVNDHDIETIDFVSTFVDAYHDAC